MSINIKVCIGYVVKGEPLNLPDGEYALVPIAATQAPSAPVATEVGNLSALVRQLVHALSKAAPSHTLPARAVDYLQRKGLQGSPLRAALSVKAEPAVPFMYAIKGPDGSAYIDENCVSATEEGLYLEVNGLNDSPDAGYSIVPVFLAAAPQNKEGT